MIKENMNPDFELQIAGKFQDVPGPSAFGKGHRKPFDLRFISKTSANGSLLHLLYIV